LTPAVPVIAVTAFTTVNATATLVLALKLASPTYFAVTLCDPTGNTYSALGAGHDARFPSPLTFAVPRVEPLSVKVTLPVAIPSVFVPSAVPVISASATTSDP
jgi:hypothetical protein